MTQKVFAVFDLKALAYMQPFFSVNAGSAMRAFGDAVKKGDSPISLHPEDYQLFEVGLWDDVAGVMSGLLPVKLLCIASDFVEACVKPVKPEAVPFVTPKKVGGL